MKCSQISSYFSTVFCIANICTLHRCRKEFGSGGGGGGGGGASVIILIKIIKIISHNFSRCARING